MINIELQGLTALRGKINLMISRGRDISPLMTEIAAIMHGEVEDNFAAGGRDPKWEPSRRVIKHGGQTLIDKGQLVSSIAEFVTATSAGVSTNKKYAAIHNFGGPLTRHARSSIKSRKTSATSSFVMPKREFMKVSPGGLSKIGKAAAKFLTGA